VTVNDWPAVVEPASDVVTLKCVPWARASRRSGRRLPGSRRACLGRSQGRNRAGRNRQAKPVLVPVVVSWKSSRTTSTRAAASAQRRRAIPSPAAARPWSAMAIKAAHCGAASLVRPIGPRRRRRIVIRIVNREARIGVGVVRHVGIGAIGCALCDHAVLVARLGLVRANAAAAAAPARLAAVGAAAQVQRRAADRHHVSRDGRITGRRPLSPDDARNVTPAWPLGVVK